MFDDRDDFDDRVNLDIVERRLVNLDGAMRRLATALTDGSRHVLLASGLQPLDDVETAGFDEFALRASAAAADVDLLRERHVSSRLVHLGSYLRD